MGIYSIKNLNLLKVTDLKSNSEFYGCDQEWYKTPFKRNAGCGPSTVSNIFLYYAKNYDDLNPLVPFNIESPSEFLELMDDMWEYVTPTSRGVNSTDLLANGGINFGKSKGIDLKANILNVPSKFNKGFPISIFKSFLINALKEDCPVAFLNFSKGKVKNLWNWHWVTIVSVETFLDGRINTIIIDEGKKKEIDLNIWYKTSKLGGGLVWFEKINR